VYYQNLNFTCGPACLLSAIQKSKKFRYVSIIDEIEIWKESNTVFMGEGHPGTCPYGLAVAAMKRGMFAKVVVSDNYSFFAKSINDREKQIIITIAQNTMMNRAIRFGAIVERKPVAFDVVVEQIGLGFMAILLVTDEDGPHWILVDGKQNIDGLTDCALTIFDPWHQRGNNLMYRSEFEKSASWEGVSCAVFVQPFGSTDNS
jgi:hypothetical protein